MTQTLQFHYIEIKEITMSDKLNINQEKPNLVSFGLIKSLSQISTMKMLSDYLNDSQVIIVC